LGFSLFSKTDLGSLGINQIADADR